MMPRPMRSNGSHGGKVATLRPRVHDANLSLGHTMRRRDHRFETQPFLQHVMLALIRGDGIYIRLGGIEFDTKPGKRVQRLQDVVFVVSGDGTVLVEQPGSRDAPVFEIGDGELADAVVPVGMSGPFHVERLGQIERKRDPFAFQLIHDAAVVDSAHRNLAAIFFVEQAFAPFLQLENIDDCDPEIALRKQKVAERLLLLRIYLQQNHIFRIVPADDQFPHQLLIRIVVVAAEIDPEVFRQSKRANIFLCQDRLVPVEGREGLQLDQPGLELALCVAHQAKVDLQEHRTRRLVGDVILRGDGDVGRAAVFRIVHQLQNQVPAILRHLVEQRFRKEAGSFGDTEGNGCAGARV